MGISRIDLTLDAQDLCNCQLDIVNSIFHQGKGFYEGSFVCSVDMTDIICKCWGLCDGDVFPPVFFRFHGFGVSRYSSIFQREHPWKLKEALEPVKRVCKTLSTRA